MVKMNRKMWLNFGIVFLTIMLIVSLEELWFGFIENNVPSGVSVYKQEKAAPGPNLFCSRDEPRAVLLHPDGRILHQWYSLIGGKRDKGWHHVELLPEGDLFAIVKDKGLLKLDKMSQRIWQSPGMFHHDLDTNDASEILILERELTDITWKGDTFPILGEFIVFLSQNGTRLRRISLNETLLPLVPDSHLEAARKFAQNNPRKELTNDTYADIFHVNSIEILRQDLLGIPAFSALLLSAREINTIFIIDLATGALLWSFGPGVLDHQHQPTLLSNGEILIFDNGQKRDWSRVIELTPDSGVIHSSIERVNGKRIYSFVRGGAQRLKNGNTLIVSGERAVALEVTPEHELVWFYKNPEYRVVRKRKAPFIDRKGLIYRMEKIEDPSLLLFLDDLRKTPPSSPNENSVS